MTPMQTMYLIFFIVMGVSMMVLVLAIAGRDMLMAFLRKFLSNGCDVYIANTNRNISHYYKVPKKERFKIKKVTYFTNPQKALNLTEYEKLKVIDSISKRKVRYEQRIQDIEVKVNSLKELVKTDAVKEQQKNIIEAEIVRLEKIILEFRNKMQLREENYYKDKRPAFFYMEGDPVPIDFYEFYSTLDSKLIDNIIAGEITTPPNSSEEKQLKMLKLLIIIACIASVVSAFGILKVQGAVKELCINAGIACKL